MTYFEDLSDYTYYHGTCHRPGTKNVGWLAKGEAFETKVPTDEFLDLLWKYCKVSVAQMMGFQVCELCPPDPARFKHNVAERKGETLSLGSAEIRVFAENGAIYAAPTLIYHYVLAHHYQPPEPFMTAICNVPAPPYPRYFERLQELGLAYNTSFSPPEAPRPFRWLKGLLGWTKEEL